ncbi:MAG TPA: VOC family protein [Candidatus Saccharimonadales bacterium]|nr:VOC family protein [Candidatus Saccharimonadales bacterium]
MNKISPFIWFVDKAEEAADFYVNLFPGSRIVTTVKSPKATEEVTSRPTGSVMTIDLELSGSQFTFMNGGVSEGFNLPNGSVSFTITCENQEEVDKYWDAFSDGGKPIACGWIQDKFGVTWQVVPRVLQEYLKSDDPELVERVVACFMKMVKYDIAELEKAAKG